jgi:5-methylcytosine-specific restriction endonuclease McrA
MIKASQPNQKSSKQLHIDYELQKVYDEMEESRPHLCTGCLANKNLTHSHLIPRSRSRLLITDPKNITYHCFRCHRKWENGVRADELMDFDQSMKYIKEKDPIYYQIRMNKLY